MADQAPKPAVNSLDRYMLDRITQLARRAADEKHENAYRHAQKARHYVWTLLTDLFGMDYAQQAEDESHDPN